MISFEEDVRQVINRHCAENPSGTPDWILAKLLTETLKTYNEAVSLRAEWRGESVQLPALSKIEAEASATFVKPCADE